MLSPLIEKCYSLFSPKIVESPIPKKYNTLDAEKSTLIHLDERFKDLIQPIIDFENLNLTSTKAFGEISTVSQMDDYVDLCQFKNPIKRVVGGTHKEKHYVIIRINPKTVDLIGCSDFEFKLAIFPLLEKAINSLKENAIDVQSVPFKFTTRISGGHDFTWHYSIVFRGYYMKLWAVPVES